MKAIFKDDFSILTMLHKMIKQSERQGRFIDRIELTKSEWDMFVRELSSGFGYHPDMGIHADGAESAIFHGIKIARMP